MAKENLKLPNELLEPAIIIHSLDNVSFFLKIKKYLFTKSEKKSYFSDPKLQRIFNSICIWHNKFSKFPKEKELKIIIDKTEKDGELKILLNSLVKELYNGDPTEIDQKFVEEETQRFIQEDQVYEAMLTSQIDIENGNFSAIVEKMQKAITVNFDKDLGLSIRDIDAGLEQINSLNNEETIPSGFASLDGDLVLDGGFRNGEIYFFAAIPGIGKCLFRDVKVMISYEIDDQTGEII